jgi:hypothetical protein
MLCLVTWAQHATAGGQYYEVTYPPSDQPGQLKIGVTYTVWVPENGRTLRGVIVHQHGCGAPACQGGATAACDLHWQSLARKWDCALLGPSYHQSDKDDCALWCDPAKGSGQAFLKALADLGTRSGNPELDTVPWCLWGHSGGGVWAGGMQLMYPERIVAVWQRSGAAGFFRQKEDTTNISPAVLSVPVMCNPGLKEKTDRFARIWEGMLEIFRAYRAKGAPIGFAPDPRTSHECGDSRYLAIPFFDACLAMRLPPKHSPSQKLKPVDFSKGWLAPLLGTNARPANSYSGDVTQAVWLPNETVARAWSEYVCTGAVPDETSPRVPLALRASVSTANAVELTWEAEADFESGLGGFIIQRDGQEIVRLPEKPVGHFGRPLFQTMSYHDTPEKPLPEMRYVDTNCRAGIPHQYCVIAVNSAGLHSKPASVKLRPPAAGSSDAARH